MKFQFIANACGIFISKKGTKILTDPWIVDGVFDGSWCHFHKLQTKVSDLQNVDAIYVSHIHPDHYDERFFDFNKDIPIIVLDHKMNFLLKNLSKKGFTNLVKVKDGNRIKFKDFDITLFAPFVKNNFFNENSTIGNLIDSAILLEADGVSAFNANDNTPDIKACKMLKNRFGQFDLSMMNYNSAGPYPSCFSNLTDAKKISEHNKNINRNIDYLARNIEVLNSKFFLPFAGSYAIGGKHHYKNEYLGTTTWDYCKKKLLDYQGIKSKVICLREQDIFDIKLGVSNRPYVKINNDETKLYIQSKLSKVVYPYEKDIYPNIEKLKADLDLSIQSMYKRISRFNLIPDTSVYICIEDEYVEVISAKDEKAKLKCKMDLRLLRRILNRKSHWNNADIGCHIKYYRKPNYYSPDISTMLQFLHL